MPPAPADKLRPAEMRCSILSKYTGIPCSRCGHTFTNQDDVVVCPECGAPMTVRKSKKGKIYYVLNDESYDQDDYWYQPYTEEEMNEFLKKQIPDAKEIRINR